MRLLSPLTRLSLIAAAFFVAGCGGGTAPNPSGVATGGLANARGSRTSLSVPALVTVNTENGSLAYWPIKHGGGQNFQSITGAIGNVNDPYAMAANGTTMLIANYSPATIVTYDIDTQAKSVLQDPYGGPLDVAIGRDGTIYALNIANVAVFAPDPSQVTELTCAYVNEGEAIAVDNEGDIFVDGYGPHGFMGVIEYPAGSQSCVKPHLRAALGYIAGVGVDPKTDDLIVVDDPDLCAGGNEGRMIIYPKPYQQRTSVRRNLNAQYCSGAFRLDAKSQHIFYADATVSAGFPLIEEARYPSGKWEGTYQAGYYSGGDFAGFTTIPNTLPN
jgi:hypothetical protein